MEWRIVINIVLCLSIVILYIQRVDINITLLSITKETLLGYGDTSQSANVDFQNETANRIRIKQGYILGSFYWGYVVTQIPGGILSLKFGPHWVIFGSIVGSSIGDLLIPVAAMLDSNYLMAIRILQGLFQGAILPASFSAVSHWVPPLERSRYAALLGVGCQLGAVAGQSLSGLIAAESSNSASGIAAVSSVSNWRLVHYIFGSIGLFVAVIGAVLFSSKPQTHRWISRAEVDFIVKSIEKNNKEQAGFEIDGDRYPTANDASAESFDDVKIERPSVPWLSILSSSAVWSLFICHFTFNWTWYTLITCMPLYMSSVHKVDIASNGLLSSLPYALMIVVCLSVGVASDAVIARRILSVTWTRRLNNAFALLVSGAGLVCVGLFGKSQLTAVVLFMISVGALGFGSSGYPVNSIDLAPTFSGSIISISNTFANLPGIFGPMVVGYLTSGQPSESNGWLMAFVVAAIMSLVAALINFFFTDGRVQLWALDSRQEKREVKLIEEDAVVN